MPLEQPIYNVVPHQGRAVMPKALSLLGLGVIFYIGVLINVSLLDLRASEETVVKIVALAIVLLLIGFGVYLARRRAQKPYIFYRKGVEVLGVIVPYESITTIETKQNVWDKLFATQKILVGGYILHHVPAKLGLEGYIRKVVEYTRNRS